MHWQGLKLFKYITHTFTVASYRWFNKSFPPFVLIPVILNYQLNRFGMVRQLPAPELSWIIPLHKLIDTVQVTCPCIDCVQVTCPHIDTVQVTCPCIDTAQVTYPCIDTVQVICPCINTFQVTCPFIDTLELTLFIEI